MVESYCKAPDSTWIACSTQKVSLWILKEDYSPQLPMGWQAQVGAEPLKRKDRSEIGFVSRSSLHFEHFALVVRFQSDLLWLHTLHTLLGSGGSCQPWPAFSLLFRGARGPSGPKQIVRRTPSARFDTDVLTRMPSRSVDAKVMGIPSPFQNPELHSFDYIRFHEHLNNQIHSFTVHTISTLVCWCWIAWPRSDSAAPWASSFWKSDKGGNCSGPLNTQQRSTVLLESQLTSDTKSF